MSSELTDGWYIRHPGTMQVIPCESFEQAMDKWFEGFNTPFLVEFGEPESSTASYERVNRYYNRKP